ncbi:MAG: 50S ribosomal protein L33 [Alphaproteobacteria bacterium]|nr:50S ribosomal protein L33 [Alphaproteobacteria bacterium]MCD8570963.1 50S ribosomal protein L33 [Alphaproteobacteria bacterium]
MAKATYVKVRLESEAGTGYRYYAKRSTRAEYKLKLKKFDPWAVNETTGKKGAHVYFVEKKMPPSKKN